MKIFFPEHGNSERVEVEELSWWYKHRDYCIVETVKKYCDKGSTFLDVGGGNGTTSEKIQKVGYKVHLIEPTEDGVLNAKNRNLEMITRSTIEEISLPYESVDAAGVFDVLEHIRDDKMFLLRIHTLLKRRAMVFVTVPAFNFLWSQDDEYGGHFKRYTVNDLRNILRVSGFKMEYVTYIFSFLVVPVFLFRTLPALLGVEKKFREDKCRNDHISRFKLEEFILKKMSSIEANHIRRSREILVGTTCLAAASKME